MALESNSNLGAGGSGFQGTGPGSAASIINELKGLKYALLAGANADTKIDLAAIRSEDTILMALNNNAGTITDETANMSIASVKAFGTLSGDTVIATDAVTVNGKTYTFQAAAPTSYGQVQIGEDDDGSMSNLADAINAYETSVEKGGADVVATVASAVVTITAVVEGTAGNAITISSADATITASGANLTGGTATGGVLCSDATDQLIMFWFDKNA